MVVSDADAALTAVVEKLYAGKTGVEAKATMGSWKSEKVAVVTSGDDVTLAVDIPGLFGNVGLTKLFAIPAATLPLARCAPAGDDLLR